MTCLKVVKVSEKLFQDNVGHGRGEIVGAPPNPPIKDITLFDVEFLCIQKKTKKKKHDLQPMLSRQPQ